MPFTPNTDMVREAYVSAWTDALGPGFKTSDELGDEFNRWLADHDAKLLENARTTLEEDRLYIKRLEDRHDSL